MDRPAVGQAVHSWGVQLERKCLLAEKQNTHEGAFDSLKRLVTLIGNKPFQCIFKTARKSNLKPPTNP